MDNSAPDAMMFLNSTRQCTLCMRRFRSCFALSRNKDQGAEITDLVLQPASLRLCPFESKKTSGAAGKLFCADSGATCTVESEQVAAKTEPYPGRWTTHFVLHRTPDLDEELFEWVGQLCVWGEENRLDRVTNSSLQG